MAEAAVEAAHSGRAVGVVVNRVRTARLVYSDLAARGLDADIWLLTGRMRPLDRQALERDLQKRLGMDRDRNVPARTAVLVSTQCIEAGADFDFDALITECASLDALRQRFGRLNRAGDIDDATATVFARSDIGAVDPIYGTSAAATWAYLNEQGPLDFGAESLRMPQGSALERLLSPSQTSPILLPAHLDAWAQTSPAPGPDPEVARWLHGPEKESADVLIVWRADVGEDELRAAMEMQTENGAPRGILQGMLSSLRERIDACPPLTSEALAVPVWAARSWLLTQSAEEESLVGDAGHDAVAHDDEGDGESRPAIVMRGGECLVVDAKRLRPWDVLIVPASYGGIRAGNWDSAATEAVSDVAEAAHLRQRGRAVLRLDERLWLGRRPPVPSEVDDGADGLAEIRTFLEENVERTSDDEARDQDRATIIRALLSDLERRPGPRLIKVSGPDLSDRWTVVARDPISALRPIPGLVSSDLAFEGEELSFIGNAASLRTHLAGVGRIAEAFARRCALPEGLVKDLRLAGELHDLGKHDPRFQRLLHGGSEYGALTAPEPLAKSSVSARNRRVQAEARRLADYPVGTRHELLSLALLQDADHLKERAHDWELVQFLVSSHHGYCRPFAPVEPAVYGDPIEVVMEHEGRPLRAASDHQLAAIDSGISDRFFSLVERFGCHGLAWLEAILRLADHRRSEQEARGS
jgi:CRISPR-associated endonuclease/helicase Cas3